MDQGVYTALEICSCLLTLGHIILTIVLVIVFGAFQVKMSLQLYQVDQKSFLLDFKSLNTQDHPDAARVKRMTRASMSMTSDSGKGSFIKDVCTEGAGRVESNADKGGFDSMRTFSFIVGLPSLVIKTSSVKQPSQVCCTVHNPALNLEKFIKKL